MPELVLVVFRVVAEALAYANPFAWAQRRRRQRRLRRLARGETALFPCDVRDARLTDGQWRNGYLAVGPHPVAWQEKGRRQQVLGSWPPLLPVSADEISVAFRSQSGDTEIRLHPDEAPTVLRALGQRGH
ncbi:hypothetical protein OYE22_16495 [Streptomyces sp. 71268]|uniref:hypothetical protein n=1 Tax=Streptomyces sp. 71268 TaxID=3002640 RepID=UPI0023F9527A|nr:hypothetical protein [Streptomyces sp. 71268]WEV26617.1 hypothetical protein OYE22_16495 [Streptomyces sp. 71268]